MLEIPRSNAQGSEAAVKSSVKLSAGLPIAATNFFLGRGSQTLKESISSEGFALGEVSKKRTS